MINIELSSCLLQKRSVISVEDIFACHLGELLNKGLRVLTLCNDGTGRSAVVAEELNNNGIPSVRLGRGIKQFTENPDLIQSIPIVQAMINNCPNIAVILTPEETKHYYGFLSNLRCLKYTNSKSAIDSIKKMES